MDRLSTTMGLTIAKNLKRRCYLAGKHPHISSQSISISDMPRLLHFADDEDSIERSSKFSSPNVTMSHPSPEDESSFAQASKRNEAALRRYRRWRRFAKVSKVTFAGMLALGILSIIPLPDPVWTFRDDIKTTTRNSSQSFFQEVKATLLPPEEPVPVAQVLREVSQYRLGSFSTPPYEFEVGDCGVIYVYPLRETIQIRRIVDCDPQIASFSLTNIYGEINLAERNEWYQQNPGAEVIPFVNHSDNPGGPPTYTLFEVDVFNRPGCRIQKERVSQDELLITGAIYDCRSLANSPGVEIVEFEHGPGCESGCLRVRSDDDLANADN